jgi:hypothetical protein
MCVCVCVCVCVCARTRAYVYMRVCMGEVREEMEESPFSVYLCIHSAKYIKVRPLVRGQR